MSPRRQFAAMLQDRHVLTIAQTVGVGLSHPICQGILLIGCWFLVGSALGREAVITLAASASGQIPPAFDAAGRNVGQNSYLLSYLASPPFKF